MSNKPSNTRFPLGGQYFWAAAAVLVLAAASLAAWRFIPGIKQPKLVTADDYIKFVQKHTGAMLEPLDGGRWWRSAPAGGLAYSLRPYGDGTYEICVFADAAAEADLRPVRRLVASYAGKKTAGDAMAAVADRLALAAQGKIEPREDVFSGAGDRRVTVSSNCGPGGGIRVAIVLWCGA